MKKLKDLFTHNSILKVISLVLGFVIWLSVVNTSNPEITETITSPLNIVNDAQLKDKGKSYSIDTSSIKISYRIRTNSRKDVKPTDFNVYVSLDEISFTGAVQVHVEPNSNVSSLVSNIVINPMVVHVDTDDVVQKPFTIEANTVGTPNEGKVAGKPVLNPSTVRLKGPSYEIGKVSRVSVDVSVEGANDDLSGAAVLQFYDSNDNLLNLSSETKILDAVNYRVPIYSTKAMSITAGVTGQPALGYTLNGFEMNPNFVTVCGPKEVLEKYNTITLPDSLVNINGATKSVTVSLNLEQYLPEGLYLIDSGNASIVAVISRVGIIGNHNTMTIGPGGETNESESVTQESPSHDSEESKSEEETVNESSESEAAEETIAASEEITDDNIEEIKN